MAHRCRVFYNSQLKLHTGWKRMRVDLQEVIQGWGFSELNSEEEKVREEKELIQREEPSWRKSLTFFPQHNYVWLFGNFTSYTMTTISSQSSHVYPTLVTASPPQKRRDKKRTRVPFVMSIYLLGHSNNLFSAP